jgi:site-specific DNA-methyltransferase (cytosine-N4-specific)
MAPDDILGADLQILVGRGTGLSEWARARAGQNAHKLLRNVMDHMVADELACSLVKRFVPQHAKILDPFCGSGRLLAAAQGASLRVGVDANPLAWLLTTTKFTKIDSAKIKKILLSLREAQRVTPTTQASIITGRKVEWFSKRVAIELNRMVFWINSLKLREPEKLLVASILSATVREVSFARLDGWKLHRLNAKARSSFKLCPWQRFEKRLRYCLEELAIARPTQGRTLIALEDARSLSRTGRGSVSAAGPYDIVLTSPPYGDSQSTVQYGAASSLCMSVVSGLKGLEHLGLPGRSIDNGCLGGDVDFSASVPNMKKYWAGASENRFGKAMARFLTDYNEACASIATNLKPGGTAIFVVGRRSTGGYRLKLDKFTIDCLSARGFKLIRTESRASRRRPTPSPPGRLQRPRAFSICVPFRLPSDQHGRDGIGKRVEEGPRNIGASQRGKAISGQSDMLRQARRPSWPRRVVQVAAKKRAASSANCSGN